MDTLKMTQHCTEQPHITGRSWHTRDHLTITWFVLKMTDYRLLENRPKSQP